MRELRSVGQAVPKKDAFSIMGGGRVYTADLVPPGALAVKLLRSTVAMGEILSIDVSAALRVPGIETILTHEDMPMNRVSIAGASYPGNNPEDRRILDRWVRFVGDPVAIVVGESERVCEKAMRLIRVKYRELPPVLDPEQAENTPTRVHPEEDFFYPCDVGGDPSRNVLSSGEERGPENFEEAYAAAPIRLDETYRTAPNRQAMMETFRTYSYFDEFGRLTLLTSTQVTFHIRRIVSQALGIPQGKVRVIKPRIGGGFGAKQTPGSELYAAAAAWKTGKPCYLQFTREETCNCTNSRHEFRIRVRLGAERDGTIRALWVDSLANAGAYSEHSVNVVGLSGHKTIPLYGQAKAWLFTYKTVFTNTQPAAAFRGFGATQGCFAVESTVNKLAERLGLDPAELRLKNLPRVGEEMSAYYGERLASCSLDRCIRRGAELSGWRENYAPAPFSRSAGAHSYRGMGMAVTMQGSGLNNIDNCAATLKLEDSGTYSLQIGASDMGTGCDTILAQMAAEVLQCDPDRIQVSGVDTSWSPYDKGSYASSTTYVTGNAVVRAAGKLLEKMRFSAAERLGSTPEETEFDGELFRAGGRTLRLFELGRDSVNGQNRHLSATVNYSGTTSPPPFAAAFAEVEVDVETGKVTVKKLTGVLDCGTVVNASLARVQAEGGFAQAVGMALYEQAGLTASGRPYGGGFLQYKIPSRRDVPEIRIAFEESYEPTGPFGAKSIGEVVMNSPVPAILSAIRNAVGAEIHNLPATSERVFRALREKDDP